MRQLRHLLRLAHSGASSREMARTLGMARSTVQENLKRAEDAGLRWPLPGDLTDDVLEHRLFSHAGVKSGARRRPEPNWGSLVVEMKKPGVTMQILWEEYRAVHAGGYLARAKDPPPGNTVMWRGMTRLADIRLGIELAGASAFVGN
ncbi:MAG: winged helix-turn-helix transcriptional regulator [Bradyrhizobium sp.]|nr:winged helix-turn-helix transcriptional regulator [Bradyrhizobium sp.]